MAAQTPLVQNPLVMEWDTPFALPPFTQIATDQFRPAFDEALREHEQDIAAITANPDAPTFANTIDALELAGRKLNQVGGVFWNLTGTDSTEDLRAIERDISPRLTRHYTAISLNPALFARVADLYGRRETLALDEEQARLLELTYKSFVRTGATLQGADRARYAEIAERLTTLETEFSQNLLANETDFLFELEESDLAGLAEDVKAAAAQTAKERNTAKPYALTLQRSSVEAFLSQSSRRDLREDLFKAWIARGENPGKTDNRPLIAQILALRQEKARLLGYKTYADYKLEPTMAHEPGAAAALMDQLWTPALRRVEEERAALQQSVDEAGGNFTLAAHDWRYYAEKLRASRYALDQAELAGYFQLENMIAAAFYCAEKLFDLRFQRRDDLPVYHPDVRAYEVTDGQGRHVAIFYGDYFARAGKRSGAWMSNFRGQKKLGGEERPVIVNVMNFSKPAPDRPSLLTLTEVITLFHEFGHALHGMLSDVVYPSMSGTSTPTDFVEFPSQVYEHWALRPEVLQKFATHFETGAPMPQALIDRIVAARHFNQGFQTVEFLASALVDFKLHWRADSPEEIGAAEAGVLQDIAMPAFMVMRHRSPHFAHIFAGESYAAGYYSYLWSETLDADGFAAFEEAGDIFDPATAKRLRDHVYAAGNRRDPNAAYAAFRGRAPDTAALLRKKGFV
ncbi:peptidyl-dipeptidase Dcp Metallo peptidase. MEROPS family M03A [Rhodoblastus acidophilus]|uniref:Peptidyl-dipeptidase Dcp Metallo peptidase. MEROPS family M03A n=1 Tax=Rhodoblastus acidophilus TaxID=1074 RepID=A0A212RZV3_RHOAC|nr:M3 family metallopeptidase [Rhodoblastus acidophilus]SNB78342.1 peptidyl-dipeptidase Dcp Metallo peptidase. MEROPS family M03A [Rhodoblastus acidophilus]